MGVTVDTGGSMSRIRMNAADGRVPTAEPRRMWLGHDACSSLSLWTWAYYLELELNLLK